MPCKEREEKILINVLGWAWAFEKERNTECPQLLPEKKFLIEKLGSLVEIEERIKVQIV
jgi:hypothetical protein